MIMPKPHALLVNAAPVRSGRRKSNRSGRSTNKSKSSQGPIPQKLQRNEVIERGIPGFRALRYRAKLNYYAPVSLSTGAGSAGTYIYSANGLFNPDITGTGHQPMPFDQIMLSFEHYCVVAARMTVNFRNSSTVNTVCVGLSLNAGPTAVSTVINLIENGVMVRDRLTVSPSSDMAKTISIPISIGKFGAVPSLLSNPDFSGNIANNPVEQSYFHLSVWCPDSGSAVSGIIAEVFIEYDSWFMEPRKNSPSVNSALKALILSEEKCGR